MVTAETALALPALVLVLGASLWGVRVTAAQLRCVDAAREAARSVARGEPATLAAGTARRAGPTGSAVDVSLVGDTVTVRVSARIPGFAAMLPAMTVAARARTELEPGVAGTPSPGAGAGAGPVTG